MFAAVALVAAACSSGDDAPAAEAEPSTTVADGPADEPAADEPAVDDSTDSEPPGAIDPPPDDPNPPETTEPPALPIDPVTLAETALLTLDDFPEGWTATPQGPDSEENDELDARVDDCLGLGPDSVTRQIDDLDVESPEFESPDGSLGVEHSVVVVADEATALQAMAEVTDPDVPGCLVKIFGEFFEEQMADPDQDDFPPGTELGEIYAQPLEIGAEPDVAGATRFVIPITDGDVTLTLVFETWYVRQGRALAQVEFRSVDDIFPIDGVESLIGTVAARLEPIG